MITGLAFTSPFLLLGLLALPVLWLLLRAIPPAPLRRRFPGVMLLLGLKDDDQVSDRTPWWLLLLRLLVVASVIIGLAGPILNPKTQESTQDQPLLIILDGGWVGGASWPATQAAVASLLSEASRAARLTAVVQLSAPMETKLQSAALWQENLPNLAPNPWLPTQTEIDQILSMLPSEPFETIWFSDGVAFDGQKALERELLRRGNVRVFTSNTNILGLRPAKIVDGKVSVTGLRLNAPTALSQTLEIHGTDPSGLSRVLQTQDFTFESGQLETEIMLDLPFELRNRVTHYAIANYAAAGAVTLTDDRQMRREVRLVVERDDREGLELLSPLHYLRQALSRTTTLLEGAVGDLIPANPDVLILADIATMPPIEEAAVLDWVTAGGTLLRFAGPHIAASEIGRVQEDPLMPVRLRAGGRTIGGAMSWGEPKHIAPFSENSPFYGLDIPEDVVVSAQVLAQPDPTLVDRMIAQLTDGTPIVTRKKVGDGQITLFHVTANAEWSSLPLSGLFVSMLDRLAVAVDQEPPTDQQLSGSTWKPRVTLNAFGRLEDASARPGVDGAVVLSDPLGPELLPGLYEGLDRTLARNVIDETMTLLPPTWGDEVVVENVQSAAETPLIGVFLAFAALLLGVDVLGSLLASGRLFAARVAVFALVIIASAPDLQAQEVTTEFALRASRELVLAHVLTGEAKLDQMAQEGLQGLSDVLFFRSSVEPDTPIGINLETDEISLFPLLYWPISPNQPIPSADAYARLNKYLRAGGLILFDTRDADVAGFGTASPNGRKLRDIAAPLDIPALEPLPADHVLTRTFYLLQDFPGRFTSRDIWVEASPPDAEQVEGIPFRNLNDGVTPVVIGGNDWAAAWAADDRGNPLYPIGRGLEGERQRELAYRFGVNLVMHVLTGNYKSDQVHVPALLERLGQ